MNFERDQILEAQFPVSGVIPGWTEALQLMPVGSKFKLFIPQAIAYGANALANNHKQKQQKPTPQQPNQKNEQNQPNQVNRPYSPNY